MTKLYKQIDVKNLEVMKYKNNAETAKVLIPERSRTIDIFFTYDKHDICPTLI